MNLFYANMTRSYVPFGNFGDDLNPWVWQRLIPDILSDEESSKTTFVGFGTLLNEKLPQFEKTIVFGTGCGYGMLPKVKDSWKIYSVRGPLSASALELDTDLGIADSSILVNRLYPFRQANKTHKVSLIPFVWEMQQTPDLFQDVCQQLGFFCIDPRWEVEKTLEAISSSELVITAAMHGAIVSDALRVPWIPFKSNAGIPDFKWTDFCQSMELDYKTKRLYRFSRIGKTFPTYRKLEKTLIAAFLKHRIKTVHPYLSREEVLESRLARLEERLDQFRKDYSQGKFCN